MTRSATSGWKEFRRSPQLKHCALEPIQRVPLEAEARFLPAAAAQLEAPESRQLPGQLSLGKVAPAPWACYPLSPPCLG